MAYKSTLKALCTTSEASYKNVLHYALLGVFSCNITHKEITVIIHLKYALGKVHVGEAGLNRHTVINTERFNKSAVTSKCTTPCF
jgi:protein-arginine kinase activator protein McsA